MDGKIKGMLFAVKYNQNLHKVGATGEFRSDPSNAIRPLMKLEQLLTQYSELRESEEEFMIKE